MTAAIDDSGSYWTDAGVAAKALATRHVQGSASTRTMPWVVSVTPWLTSCAWWMSLRTIAQACRHYPCIRVYLRRVQGLHKRFFSLQGSTLKYYKDATCKNLRTKIELKAGTLVHRLSKTMFTIKSDVQKLSLVAEDECTCESWVNALKARIQLSSAAKKNEHSSCDDPTAAADKC